MVGYRNRGKNAILDGTDIEPIVWVIDNFARNHRLGLIYEAKVDNGSVLFCQPDLLHKDEIAAKWLFYSLYQYAASERFVPEQTMEPGQIEKCMDKNRKFEEMHIL